MTPESKVNAHVLRDKIRNRCLEVSCGCWLWLRGSHEAPSATGFSNDYGKIWNGGRNRKAHHVAFEAWNGPIPEGLVVRHTCDVPSCCNPEHLILGTRGDNVRDMQERGRQRRGEPRCGSASHLSKLTEAQVLQIRQRYAAREMSQQRLGAEYGISQTAVHKIVSLQRWRHI